MVNGPRDFDAIGASFPLWRIHPQKDAASPHLLSQIPLGKTG
jgi:hypothetical protein